MNTTATVIGRVKWFDSVHGYGFIVPNDNELPDVLLHRNVLLEAGITRILPQTMVTAEAVSSDKGWRVSKVLEVDDSTVEQIDDKPSVVVGLVNVTPEFEPAVVKWYNVPRGYGFVKRVREPQLDIFVHATVLERCGLLGPLIEGHTVLVRHGQGNKGLTAVDLRMP